jgi:hypothetical protein
MTTRTHCIRIEMKDGSERLFESPKGDLTLTTYGPFVAVLGPADHIYIPADDIAQIVAAAPRGASCR